EQGRDSCARDLRLSAAYVRLCLLVCKPTGRKWWVSRWFVLSSEYSDFGTPVVCPD
ncbi:MAG: hypothetical protein JWN96_332, partial [Mycobacterium sp.]|nr:hypothetical protein [Mycobacterium sp.]